MKKDFCSEFTLQSIESQIKHYKQTAKEYKTTVSEQSELYPLEVNVSVYEANTEFAKYQHGQTLGYTQKLISLSSTQKKVEAEIKRTIRQWYNLSNRFNITVNFQDNTSE